MSFIDEDVRRRRVLTLAIKAAACLQILAVTTLSEKERATLEAELHTKFRNDVMLVDLPPSGAVRKLSTKICISFANSKNKTFTRANRGENLHETDFFVCCPLFARRCYFLQACICDDLRICNSKIF